MDVFFVLSGFLITSLLLREWVATGDLDLSQFYIRRALRLGPALLALLMAACLYETLYLPYPGVESIFVRSIYALSYFANWVWAFRPDENPLGSLDSMWSLAVEEQFYFIWPVTLLYLLRWRPRLIHLGWILLLTTAAAATWRYALWQARAPMFRLYAGSDSHADPILLGCFLAILAHGVSSQAWAVIRPWISASVPFAVTTLLLMMLLFDLSNQTSIMSGPTGVAILTGILILGLR